MAEDITYTYSEEEFGEWVDEITQHEPTAVFEYPKTVLIIEPDNDPWNPLEGDHFGHMICFHRRYDLGDEHDEPHQKDAFKFQEWIKSMYARRELIYLPLYLYDHSGITISYNDTYPYNDPWDAGLVGYIYATNEDIRENWGIKKATMKWQKQAYALLKDIVDEYDQYLRGDAYGFTLMCKTCGETLDSTWGFFGDNWKENGLLDAADPEGWVCPDCIRKDEDAWMKVGLLVVD
jgi:hypothetical protein